MLSPSTVPPPLSIKDVEKCNPTGTFHSLDGFLGAISDYKDFQ